MISPEAQAAVAEGFGEAPVNLEGVRAHEEREPLRRVPRRRRGVVGGRLLLDDARRGLRGRRRLDDVQDAGGLGGGLDGDQGLTNPDSPGRMTSVPVLEPPPRESPGRRLSTFFYRHPRIRLWTLLALPRRVARARLLRVAVRPAPVVVLGDGLVHARGRPHVHARELRAHPRDAGLPRRRLAHDPDGSVRDDRGRRPRVPDRVLHGARRLASDARPARRPRARPALGELPRQGVRVADDPLRGRRHQLGARAVRLHFDGLSTVGLWLVFTYLWLPFMILPIYAGLERIPSSFLEASADLGGRSFTTFTRVILPARVPGDRRRLDLHVLPDARRLHRARADHERAVHRHGDLLHPRRGAADGRRVLARPDRRRRRLPARRAPARGVRDASDGRVARSRGSCCALGALADARVHLPAAVRSSRCTRSTRTSRRRGRSRSTAPGGSRSRSTTRTSATR